MSHLTVLVASLWFSWMATGDSSLPFWAEKAVFTRGDRVYAVGLSTIDGPPERRRIDSLQNAIQEILGFSGLNNLESTEINTARLYEDDKKHATYRLVFVATQSLRALGAKLPEKPRSGKLWDTLFDDLKASEAIESTPFGAVTAGVLKEAKEIDQKSIENEKSRKEFIDALERKCTDSKDLNSCYLFKNLTDKLVLPNLSEDRKSALAKLQKQFDEWLTLCKLGHPLSCIETGNHFVMYETHHPPLESFTDKAKWRVRGSLKKVFPAAGKGRESFPSVQFVPEVINSESVADCVAKKDPIACFDYGTIMLTVGPPFFDKLLSTVRARLIESHCPEFSYACERVPYALRTAGLINQKELLSRLDSLCTKKSSAHACSVLAAQLAEEDDPARKLSITQLACQMGEHSSCEDLASRMLTRGDTDGALRLAVMSCTVNERNGCWFLTEEFIGKRLLNDKPNRLWAAKYACSKGQYPACRVKSAMALHSGLVQEARREFGIRCDLGDIEGCRDAAQVAWLQNDVAGAADLLEIGCNRGGTNSCYELANLRMYQGKKEEAIRLYKVGCFNGSPSICEALKAARKKKPREIAKTGAEQLRRIFQEPLSGL